MKKVQVAKSVSLVALQVAIPAALLVGARWMALGNGPARASAASSPAAPMPEPWSVEPEETIDEPTRRMLEAGLSRTGAVIARDPFHSPAFEGGNAALAGLMPAIASESEAAESAPRLPALRLSSIASGRDLVAVINGSVRRVGDSVGDDWTIERIDHITGTVTIEHASGATETISLSR